MADMSEEVEIQRKVGECSTVTPASTSSPVSSQHNDNVSRQAKCEKSEEIGIAPTEYTPDTVKEVKYEVPVQDTVRSAEREIHRKVSEGSTDISASTPSPVSSQHNDNISFEEQCKTNEVIGIAPTEYTPDTVKEVKYEVPVQDTVRSEDTVGQGRTPDSLVKRQLLYDTLQPESTYDDPCHIDLKAGVTVLPVDATRSNEIQNVVEGLTDTQASTSSLVASNKNYIDNTGRQRHKAKQNDRKRKRVGGIPVLEHYTDIDGPSHKKRKHLDRGGGNTKTNSGGVPIIGGQRMTRKANRKISK